MNDNDDRRPEVRAGQRMFLAYTQQRDQGREHEIVVTRVGRKYAYARRADAGPGGFEIRFTLTDPHGRMYVQDAPGYTRHEQQVYTSRDAWRAETERDAAMAALRHALEWGAPVDPRVTAKDVARAAELLRVLHVFRRKLEQRR